MTPDEAREKARQSARDGFALNISVLLKENFQYVSTLVGGNIVTPTDAGFDKMARELLEEGSITVRNADGKEKTLTRGQLKKILKKLPPDTLNAVLAGKTLDDIALSPDKVGESVGAIGDAVANNTGAFFGATFGNIVKGFFSWLAGFFRGKSSFSGEDSLVAHITRATADSMKADVTRNLTGLLGEERSDDIAVVAQKVHDAAMNKVPDKNSEKALENVKIKDVSNEFRDMVGDEVYTATVNATNDGIYEEIKRKREQKYLGFTVPDAIAGFYIPDSNQVNKASEAVAGSMKLLITDPNFRYKDKALAALSKDEFQQAVHDTVLSALKKSQNDGNIRDFSQDALAQIAQKSAQEARNKYDELPISGLATMDERLKQAAQQAVSGKPVESKAPENGGEPQVPVIAGAPVNTPQTTR